MPNFLHEDGRSVEVELRGRTVVVSGQADRVHPSPGEAREACAAITRELLGEGFRPAADVRADRLPKDEEDEERLAPNATPSHAELEAALESAGDDPAPYLVYGDFLQSQDDPWGELIALQASGPQYREKAEAYLEKARDALFGELTEAIAYQDIEPTWRFGFIVGATLKNKSEATLAYADLCQLFLNHRMTRLLESIEVDRADIAEPVLRTSAQAKQLLSLRMDASARPIDISPLGEAYPKLEALSVQGWVKEPFVFPRLQRLVLDDIPALYVLGAMTGSSCPELVTFGGDVRTWSYSDGTDTNLGDLFDATAECAPKIEQLDLSVPSDRYAAMALDFLSRSALGHKIRTVVLRFSTTPSINAIKGTLEYVRHLDSVRFMGMQPTERGRAVLVEALGDVLRIG